MKHTITILIVILVQFVIAYNLPTTDVEPVSFMFGNLQVLAIFVIFHILDKRVA